MFYLGFKVYPLHCVLAMQARVCGPGRTGRTEPTRIRIRGIRATGLLIYSYNLTCKDWYPLPLIDETLAKLAKAKVYTKLDIR